MAGVPAVAHGWGAPLWNADEQQMIDQATAALWHAHDVVPASPGGLFDHLYLDLCPPPLQAEDAAQIRRRRTVRFRPFDSGEPLPRWLDDLGERPLVYVTLGTVPTFNSAPEVLTAVAHGVADLAVDAVMAVGTNNDPLKLEPLPLNVHAVRFLPQAQVLSRCQAAITHGGAGSTLAALALGVPLLILPRGAPSQQRLAARCVGAEAAVALDPGEISAPAIREAVLALLEDPRLRAGAERIRASIQAQPDVSAVVDTLEALTEQGAA
jgi:UDP:flavonoid glycosyltransferase YjiC (YdhE family)